MDSQGKFSESAAPHGFSSDAEAWEQGYRLLQQLYDLRGLRYNPPDHVKAEAAVHAFSRRLRASDRAIRLAVIQRTSKADSSKLVILLYAIFLEYGLYQNRTLRDACVLAVGHNIKELRRLGAVLLSRRWIVGYDEFSGGLYCTQWLLDAASDWSLIGEAEARWLKGRIELLPTAYDREQEKGGVSDEKSDA